MLHRARRGVIDQDRETNRAWWDERAALHADTPMYRPWIDALRRGEPALFPLERRLAGEVAGLRVLHLPCHIGHDTLSWALLGAHVTGVDFSPVALDEARRLTAAVDLPEGVEVDWLEADGCALPASLHGRYDLVVSTYGAYGWMKDLPAYLDGVARCLAPGGRFLLVDGHPTMLGLSKGADGVLKVVWPMMGGAAAVEAISGSYADRSLQTVHDRQVGWCHGIGDLVQGLLDAGLVLEHLEEHGHCVWEPFTGMVQRDDDPEGAVWRLADPDAGIPLTLSMVARRPLESTRA